MVGRRGRYHDVGTAIANIFPLSGCSGIGAFSAVIVNVGGCAASAIFTVRSSMPIGVAGDADEAGDDELDVDDDGVSGVLGE